MPQTDGYSLMDDIEPDEEPTRDKEIRYRSSAGRESFKRKTKPLKESHLTSLSCEESSGTQSGTRPSSARSSDHAKNGSVDVENIPLVQSVEESDKSDEYIVVDIPGEEVKPTAEKERWSKIRQRFWSAIVFLLPLATGCVLNIAVNVNTGTRAREITPAVFHSYTVCLIIVFILWLAFEAYHHNPSKVSDGDKFEPLIPSHLLDGLALFAVCNCAFQVIMFVDFIKCNRHVSGLDKSYVVSASFEMLFVYCQIYVFYSLSRRRKEKLWFGNYFTMFTLAINLTLWGGYFAAGAVNHPDLEHVPWLRRYHYGLKEDLCANSSHNTGNHSRELHNFVLTLLPYKYTFAMEYSLLASALLYHLWIEIATPSAGEFAATNKKWFVWRFGFIFGLSILPLIGVLCAYSTVKYSSSNATILYTFEFVLWILVFLSSVGALWLLTHRYKKVPEYKAKVDTKLLCFSALGFVILDLFTIFATVATLLKSYDGDYFLLGLSALGELITCSILTVFIYATYFYKVIPSKEGIQAAKLIRQIASFCLTVSIGFWILRTYTFRSEHDFNYVGRDYFGKTTWFVISQFATPMCIYFHYHCAICLSGSIADNT